MTTPSASSRSGRFSRLRAAAMLTALLPASATLGHPGHAGGHADANTAGPDAHPARPNDDQPLPFQSRIEIVIRDGYRYITANGVPDHPTGRFPSRGNPNAIRQQHYHFRLPLSPKINDQTQPSAGQPFGIALNGVVFDPYTAGFWNDDRQAGWRETADPRKHPLGIDANHAHVQPNGAYHYHGIPTPLIDSDNHMTLVGWAADGFPIYGPIGPRDAADPDSPPVRLRSSYRLKPGPRPADGPPGDYDGTYEQDYQYIQGSGDLDECNGRVGVTPQFPKGTYYYVLTDDYPWVPRLFRGTPDESFTIRSHNRRQAGPGQTGPGAGGGPHKPGHQPPPPRP